MSDPDVGTKEWVLTKQNNNNNKVKNLTMSFRAVWKAWEDWTRKVVRCSKKIVTGRSSWSLEDNSADRADGGGTLTRGEQH